MYTFRVRDFSNVCFTLYQNWHKMAIRIKSFEFRAKNASNLVKSQSIAEESTMLTEGCTKTHKGDAVMWFFMVITAGQTKDTQRPQDSYMPSSSNWAILQELKCDCHWNFSCSGCLLHVKETTTHGNRLNNSNLYVFADTVVLPRCHNTIIQ